MKHSNNLTITNEENDAHSSSTSRVNVKRIPVSTGDQVEGEHLSSTLKNEIHDSIVKGEHMPTITNIEGERMPNHVDVEGENYISKLLVEDEPSGSNHDNGDDQNNDFHDVTDNITIVGEGS